MTDQPTDDRSRRREALVAWGALAGVAALLTTAAFTDVARLNLGSGGIGGSDSTYNIQVGGTDGDGTFVAGTWQEADDAAGVPIAISGAESVFPGSTPISVEIPVRNDSTAFASSLSLTLSQLADDAGAGRVTDANYLSSLRFDVAMPGTSRDATPVAESGLTFAQASAVVLNELAAEEESTVTLTIALLSQSESGAAFGDNTLSGKGAFLQATFDGTSV
jgi:hypothetical protein